MEERSKITILERKIQELTAKLNELGSGAKSKFGEVDDYLAQFKEQVIASAPANAIKAQTLPKAEYFEGTRTKLRGFLTQMDMHLDVNKIKLPSEASKVIFVSTYLRGQAWNWLEPHIRDYYEKSSEEWSATTTEIFENYGNFRRHLERTFGDIDATRTAERKLQKI